MRPDTAALVIAAFPAAGAIAAYALGAPWVAVALAGSTAIALRLLWRAPECDDGGNDIEALIDATREDMPDYVPAEWTRELS